jgi:hypothetical protein
MLLFLATLAASPAVAEAPTAVAPVQFSIVALPERAGRFTYQRSRLDDKTSPASVRADYEALDKPGDPWIAVHLMPTGRVAEAVAVEALAQAFEESLRGSAALTKIVALRRSPIQVDAPDPPSLYAHRRIGATRGWTPPLSRGSRQSFTYVDRDGQLERHAGLVFHRHLFDIDVRVRVAAEDMGQSEFDALADEAAREIVPRLDLRNFGDCGVGGRADNCAPDEAGAAVAAGVQHVLARAPGAAPQSQPAPLHIRPLSEAEVPKPLAIPGDWVVCSADAISPDGSQLLFALSEPMDIARRPDWQERLRNDRPFAGVLQAAGGTKTDEAFVWCSPARADSTLAAEEMERHLPRFVEKQKRDGGYEQVKRVAGSWRLD